MTDRANINFLNRESVETYLSACPPFDNGLEINVREIERHSRNTILYRIQHGDRKLVGKVSITKPASLTRAEYEILCELDEKFSSEGVRSLRPVAFLEDSGIMITEEDEGEDLDRKIYRELRRADGSSGGRIENLVRQAAAALFEFHKLYGIRPDGKGGLSVRHYLDFAPRNVLVSVHDEIILLDPPEYKQEGSPSLDLGTFCFELGRCSLKAWKLSPSGHDWLNSLKFLFIESYLEKLGLKLSSSLLNQVRNAEVERADKVLKYYRNFSQFENRFKEFGRLFVVSPVIIYYRNIVLPKSYDWMDNRFVDAQSN